MKTSRLRNRSRNGPKTGSIAPPSFFLPLAGGSLVTGVAPSLIEGTLSFSWADNRMMAGQGARFCAGLLTFARKVQATSVKIGQIRRAGKAGVSNLDQLFSCAWVIMMLERAAIATLFRGPGHANQFT
jgi:hypothetical protein